MFSCVSCILCVIILLCSSVFFFQAEDGIRDLVRSRGLGDVYKRQVVGMLAQSGLDGRRLGRVVERRCRAVGTDIVHVLSLIHI